MSGVMVGADAARVSVARLNFGSSRLRPTGVICTDPHLHGSTESENERRPLGSADVKAPIGFAGLPIGLVLVLIHLVGIPVTNLSVNPARSIS